MRIQRAGLSLVIFAISLFACQQVGAASLTGKVIEINDGDEITIFNLNRPVRIKLLGIDAPEKEQTFGAIARQHLSDLVYDKVVSVEYWGIGHNSSLIGRVLLNDNDICAQMIRDGAAWFDPNNKGGLAELQRQVYQQSEQAARSEKRGLWQTDGAVAPWEFVKAEELKKNPIANLPVVRPSQPIRSDRPTPELTNLSLLRTGTAVAQPQSALGDMSWADGSVAREWHQFKPAGQNFSATIPQGGKQMVKSVPFGDQMINVNYYMVREGDVIYELVWVTGPFLGETDAAALQAAFDGFLRGVNTGFERAGGGNFQCEGTSQHNISYAGYAGREYDLSQCTVPGMTRIYTKVIGSDRQIYAGLVFYKQEDENASKFLKSFTVIGRKSEGQKTKATR